MLLALVLALVSLPGAGAAHDAPGAQGAAGPPYTAHTYERVQVPMRDGVTLSVDVWRPVVPDGVKVPVILSMTPYHALYKALDRREDDLSMAVAGDVAKRFVPLGYAYAQADVRGTYNSGGCWDYGGINERRDGYDLVEWLAGHAADGSASPAASWSAGRVGMIGASYDGTTANAAAVEQPPHLATIVPVSAISRWWGYAYQQGARATYSGESVDIDPPGDTPADFMLAYGMAPPPDPATVTNAEQVAMRWNVCDRVRQTLAGYDTQPDYDEFWVERDYLRLAERVTVPVLVAHGLLDFNVKTWEGTAWFGALPGEKMLVLGQWAHAWPGYSLWNTLLRRWFERWLYGVENGVEHEPAVRVAANAGAFRSQDTWGEAPATSFALDGSEVSYLDDGTLTESEMVRGVMPSRYVRASVAGTEGVHIEGRPVLRLRASATAPGTHFVAVLCDTGPSGGCDVVSRAFLNARYNDSLERGRDLVNGAPATYSLEFIDKDYRLAPGHHLELLIASSSTTWVAPDEHRSLNTIRLSESSLELPLR